MKISDVIKELQDHMKTIGDREVVKVETTGEVFDIRYIMTQPVGSTRCTIGFVPVENEIEKRKRFFIRNMEEGNISPEECDAKIKELEGGKNG